MSTIVQSALTVPPKAGPSFKADLLYGATKTRKTSNIGIAALYCWEKYGLRTRLATADTGGFEPIQSLVDEGIIEQPLVLVGRQFPIETVDMLCQGYWPAEVNDPKSPMVAVKDWSGVGLVAIEGLTSIGSMIMRHWQSTRQRLSQDPNYVYTDGAHSYSGSNQSYYGEVQTRIYDFVVKSSTLPVRKVIWTALEARGEDRDKTPVYGPAIEGKKSIGKAGQWFGNMLHFEMIQREVAKDAQGQIKLTSDVVMYLKPHADPISKIPFHAGTRAPFQLASELPDYMDADIGKLYAVLETLKERARAGLRKA